MGLEGSEDICDYAAIYRVLGRSIEKREIQAWKVHDFEFKSLKFMENKNKY